MKPLSRYSYFPSQICKVCYALYGLKQALCTWFEKFSYTIGKFGFHSSASNPGFLIRKINFGITLLFLYVDDILITESEVAGISDLKQSLSCHFEIKDPGRLNYFLGLEILSDYC